MVGDQVMTRSRGKACADTVTLSSKDWAMLFGVLLPVAALVIMGWLRHDRMLTTLVAHQSSLNDRIERVEETLDVRGIRP
jgi:hypothetical protein